MSRFALLAALAGALVLTPDVSAQGDLRRIQTSFHPGPKFFLPKWPNKDSSSDWGSGGSTVNNFGQSGGGEGAAGIIVLAGAVGILAVIGGTAPIWYPHSEYDAGFDARGWFPPNPYPRGDRRYLVAGNAPLIPTQGDNYLESDHVKPWALRITADTGDNFDGLHRTGGELFLDTSVYRLGFLADENYYTERTPFGTDNALVSTYSLTWRITQCDWLLVHLGAGIRLWNANDRSDAGPNFLYRADVFPDEPIHMTGIFEIGTVRSALVLHGRLEAGYTIGHGELFAGFDVLRVKKIPLYSPTVGVRLWF